MRTRVVAPVVAAVLGICGGVTAALLAPADEAPEPPGSDPLTLGLPLRNQDCTGAALLVLGYGDSRAPLATAVVNNEPEGLSYLASEDSCATILGPERKPTPEYVLYRGPYPAPREPCELRMSGGKGAGFVTVLREGNTQLVKCPCELPGSDAPRLFLHMDADARDTLWIRSLQAMLRDDDPEGFPHDAITGVYDQRTADRVALFQDDAPGQQTTRGVVDEVTWGILTERLCRHYTY